ncbi:MAG: HEAT repeat domain-containing protein [Phycisphaerae bacterium]|nr:HEAT repeat domain-containing protein [Phycisphaerae bacterium]
MSQTGGNESPLHVAVEYDSTSRRMVICVLGGASHSQVYDAQTEADILNRLRLISSAGRDVNSALTTDPRPVDAAAGRRSPQSRDLEALGKTLGSFLFGGEVGEETRERLRAARQQDKTLNIRLTVNNPCLEFLPWETASISAESGEEAIPLCWLSGVQLLRAGRTGSRGQGIAGRLEVGVIIEDPGYVGEIQRLREAVQDSHARDLYLEEPLVEQGWSSVFGHLGTKNWHVLVFGGHVHTRGRKAYLRFADGDVEDKSFIERAIDNEDLRCVVLLGCSTWHVLADRFLARGVPAVLGTNFYVPRGAPKSGLRAFLTELARSGRVDAAYGALRSAWPKAYQGAPVLAISDDDTQLFTDDPILLQLGSYVGAIRNRLSRLEVLSDTCESWRAQLYRPRYLTWGQTGWDPQDDGEQGQRRETRPQSALMKELLTPGVHPKVSVTGDAGAGKSTFLDDMAWHLARRFLLHPKEALCRIPFTIDLTEWRPDLHETINELAAHTTRLDTSLVDDLFARGKAVLLLDGLDEVNPQARREMLFKWLDREVARDPVSHNAVVIAGRPWAFERMPLRRFRKERLALEQFDRRDVEAYISARFCDDPDRGRRLLRQLEGNPLTHNMVRKPLLLMLLCFVKERGDMTLPANEGELLELAVHELLRRREQQLIDQSGEHETLTRSLILRLLGRLAWACWSEAPNRQLTSNDALALIRENTGRDTAPEDELAGGWLNTIQERVLRQSGMLVQSADQCVRFADQTFLEYFAGRWLARQSEKEIRRAFNEHAWDPAWMRPFVFMMGSLWARSRTLASRLIRWLLAEIDEGYDDSWRTLVMLCSRFLNPAGRPRDDSELELARDVAEHAFGAWCFVVRNRYRAEERDFAHESLLALIPLVGADIIARVVGALEDSELGPYAVEALALIATDEATGSLGHQLANAADPQLRARIAEALGLVGSKSAIAALTQSLDDQDRHVRSTAAESLGRIGSDRTVAPLIAWLNHGENSDRCATVEALGRIRTDRAIAALVDALLDPDVDVQEAAAETLAEIGLDRTQDAIISGVRRLNEWTALVLGTIGSDRSLQVLIDALTDTDPTVRSCAAMGLGVVEPDRAIPALIGRLEDDDGNVRAKAAEALGRTGSILGVAPLIQALRDDADDVRIATAKALGNIRSDQPVDALVFSLKHDRVGAVRAASASALGLIASDRALHALIAALNDDVGFVRGQVVVAISQIPSEISVTALVAALSDLDRQVRQIASVALVWVFGGDCSRAVGVLIDALAHEHDRVRRNAARALGWMGGGASAELKEHFSEEMIRTLRQTVEERAVGPLGTVVADRKSDIRPEAAEALRRLTSPRDSETDALIEALRDGDAKIRRPVVTALGTIGSDRAVDALIASLSDSDGDVRELAAEALGKTGSHRAVEPLVRLLLERSRKATEEEWGERYALALALGRIGSDQALDALLGALGDPHAWVRSQAAEQLGKLGAEKAVAGLTYLLKDPDRGVRGAAAIALGDVGSADAVDALMNALQDEDDYVRLHAAESLGKIGSGRASEALISLLDKHARQVDGLEAHDDTASGNAEAGAGTGSDLDPDAARLGQVVGEALGRIGTDHVVDALIKIRRRKDDRVGFNALRGLARIKTDWSAEALLTVARQGASWAGHLLDERCREQKVTVLQSGRVAKQDELRLHLELWPQDER